MDARVRTGILVVLFAFLWMILQESYAVGSFVGGLVVGLVILLIFPAPVHGLINPYVRRPGGIFRWLVSAAHLFLYYTRHWLRGNAEMARLMLRRDLSTITPGVLKFPLRVRQPGQVALLANLITVTPGSYTVEVSDEWDVLYLHVIDASDAEAALAPIRRIEELIMEVLQ